MPGFHITTQDDLPGPDGDEPYVLFVNETEYGNGRFLRTNVLSARPDLKKYTSLRFRQDVKRHADGLGPGQDLVLVFMEAIDHDPPLTLVSSNMHLELEGYPVEQGLRSRYRCCRHGSAGRPRVSAESAKKPDCLLQDRGHRCQSLDPAATATFCSPPVEPQATT